MKHTIWKTISFKGKPNLKGINISSYAQDMLDKIKFPTKKQTFGLVKVSVKELGFESSATLKEIYTKAKEQGLELCPPEVGPHLREQYKDQPANEWIWMAMEPVSGRYHPHVFNVEHNDDGLWLFSLWTYPDLEWYPGTEFVFRLGKSLKSLDSSDLDSLKLRILALESKLTRISEILK